MSQAMQDLLTEKPNVDLLSFGDDDIWTLIESFLAASVQPNMPDIGQVFENSALASNPSDTNERNADYLKAELLRR